MEEEKMEITPKKEEEFQLDYNLLEEYYRNYFPITQMVQWLSYPHNGDLTYLQRREFSFTLKDEIYIRYQMFNNEKELKNALLTKIPEKIDIGAVYNKQGKKGDDITAVEKEFVIDIDMTDYDNIRTCCSKAKICPKCWKFMRVACNLISKCLDEDFGFQHILWVYSGRRGIHAWVCDREARKAKDQARSAIIDYMNIIIDNTAAATYVKANLLKLESHYLIERNAMQPLIKGTSDAQIERQEKESEKDFIEIVLKDQDLFMKKPKIILEFLAKRNEDFSKEVERQWKVIQTSLGRYEAMKEEIKYRKENKKLNYGKTYHCILEELKIWLLYPRLDVNVSRSTNHLLKSPFCIHPKTGNVCVPFTTQEINTFDPFTVPNISTLATEDGKKKMRDCLKIFNAFLENLKEDV